MKNKSTTTYIIEIKSPNTVWELISMGGLRKTKKELRIYRERHGQSLKFRLLEEKKTIRILET